METLTATQRRALRAKAHHLHPVVIIGQHGLTPAVASEIDLALAKHELVKVRVFSDAREDRDAMLATICADMDCAAVQYLGKVLVIWRPNPEVKKPAPVKREPKAATKSGAKRPKAPKTGPRAPVDPVRERRRGTQADVPQIGKGTRGAARFNALPEGAPLPPRGAAPPPRRTRATEDAPAGKRKSSWTAKTTPRSFSAKPNPREAWAKKPPAGSGKTASASATPRRRRKA